MTTSGTDVATRDKKIMTLKRTISASAARMLESEMLDFLVELDPDNFDDGDFETFRQLMGDLDYLGEGELKSRHSTTAAKITARKWYSANKAGVKKMAKKRKTKGAKKKQETMAKSKRTLSGKDKRLYNTKGHLSEADNRRIHEAAKARVEELFAPDRYLVIRPFTMGKIEATYGELLEYHGGNLFTLHKRGGNRFKFELQEGQKLTGLVKPEAEVTTEDYV